MRSVIDGFAGATLACTVGCLGLATGWLALTAASKRRFKSGIEVITARNGSGYFGPILMSFCSVCSWRVLITLLPFGKLALSDKSDIKIGTSNPSIWTSEKRRQIVTVSLKNERDTLSEISCDIPFMELIEKNWPKEAWTGYYTWICNFSAVNTVLLSARHKWVHSPSLCFNATPAFGFIPLLADYAKYWKKQINKGI